MRNVGTRVSPDSRHGFALADLNGAQFPVASTDSGRTWRIAGPYLHVNAADAAESVDQIGARDARLLFADGSAVVDLTPDAGRHWYQASIATGAVLGVVYEPFTHLLYAFTQPDRSSGPIPTWLYVSNDGIHRRYTVRYPGGS